MAGKQRADHHHRGAKADALGNVAVAADAAIGNDGLGRHTGTPLQSRQLPPAGAKAGLELGDADLAGAHAHFGGVCAPVFQINHGFRRGHIACNHKAVGQLALDVGDHVAHAVGVAVSDVDGDVLRHQTRGGQFVDGGAVGRFHAQRDRGIHTLGVHVFDELDVVQIKAVHHVEVMVLRHPQADAFIHHGFHVGRHHGEAEFAATEFDACITF